MWTSWLPGLTDWTSFYAGAGINLRNHGCSGSFVESVHLKLCLSIYWNFFLRTELEGIPLILILGWPRPMWHTGQVRCLTDAMWSLSDLLDFWSLDLPSCFSVDGLNGMIVKAQVIRLQGTLWVCKVYHWTWKESQGWISTFPSVSETLWIRPSCRGPHICSHQSIHLWLYGIWVLFGPHCTSHHLNSTKTFLSYSLKFAFFVAVASSSVWIWFGLFKSVSQPGFIISGWTQEGHLFSCSTRQPVQAYDLKDWFLPFQLELGSLDQWAPLGLFGIMASVTKVIFCSHVL